MDAVLKKHTDGRFSLSHKESGWWIGDSDHDKVKAHKGEQILSKLSLKNCEAIANGYDLDELAKYFANKHEKETDSAYEYGRDMYSFKIGFQKALEILGDKKFSEDDIRKVIESTISSCSVKRITNRYVPDELLDEVECGLEAEDIIQELQQTEWDVIVEMESIPADRAPNGWDTFPKLDANGFLILKLK